MFTDVNTFVDVNQADRTRHATHVCLRDQLIAIYWGALPLWNLTLAERMQMRFIPFVAPFTKTKVVALVAVVTEMARRDWLQTVISITNVPSLKPTLLSRPISLLNSLLLKPFGHFSFKIPLTVIFL
jgi:hypothetical protein